MTYDIKFSAGSNTSESSIFGNRWEGSQPFLMLFNDKIRWHQVKTGSIDISMSQDNYNHVICNYNSISVNGTITTFESVSTIDSSTITLFGVIRGSYAKLGNKCDHKIVRFIISENEKILRHFIPVQNPVTLEAGMYDLVSGKFYGNSGTGEFEFVIEEA